MYHRYNNDRYVSDEFKIGVKQFFDFAFSHFGFTYRDKIRLPCFKCINLLFYNWDDVTIHLYRKGFIGGYATQDAYGESYVGQSSSENNDVSIIDNANSYRSMVTDVLGLEFD